MWQAISVGEEEAPPLIVKERRRAALPVRYRFGRPARSPGIKSVGRLRR